VLGIHPPEHYREIRKQAYERSRSDALEAWEHDGYGYEVFYHDRDRWPWILSRTDLQDYYAIAYQFWTREEMEEHIERHGWRPRQQETVRYEQLTLF
jgi:hypothetical protein